MIESVIQVVEKEKAEGSVRHQRVSWLLVGVGVGGAGLVLVVVILVGALIYTFVTRRRNSAQIRCRLSFQSV